MIDEIAFPSLSKIIRYVLMDWPDHERFLGQSFAKRDPVIMQASERLAGVIMRIIGAPERLDRYCADYRFLCGRMLEEEIFFRRNGRYRLSRFEEAFVEIYSNHVFMDRYMNFLLLTHVLWDNHARAMFHFEKCYLEGLPCDTDHLEIGPGHGLLLHMALRSFSVRRVVGWDVSKTSIDQTRNCLATLDSGRDYELLVQDMFADASATFNDRKFGSVVMAEVLEHLEDPVRALKAVSSHMSPDGLLWIHVPINSPAPDHLYLLRSPEEALDMVRAGGFDPVDWAFFPMAGQTIDRARKHQLTISVVITAKLRSGQQFGSY